MCFHQLAIKYSNIETDEALKDQEDKQEEKEVVM